MKKYIRFIIIALVVVVSGIIYSCQRDGEVTEVYSADEETLTSEGMETQETETAQTVKEICVDVSGCVVNPGVYMMPEGSRVYEAVEYAGGFLPEADKAYLNLAAVVIDGQKLLVLSKEEAATASKSQWQSSENETSGKVNINTATKEELMTLSGIGESRAKSIINYRESHGGFSAIEDIMNVSGIKEAAFEKIKDSICVE